MEIGVVVEIHGEAGGGVAEEEGGVVGGEEGAGELVIDFLGEDCLSSFVVGCYEAVYFWEGAGVCHFGLLGGWLVMVVYGMKLECSDDL